MFFFRIAIAGASGFIGKNLINFLPDSYEITGLSRSSRESTKNVNWVETDLFSFQSIQNSLKNTDVAIYLVHSMLPSSRLFQGNFQDTDLLLADNFAKACVKNNVKQIIYLGGLVPVSGNSKHLDSRLEVEDVFKETKIPLTILRSGMVVGEGGSSFEILRNLVFNLPGMLLPKWSKCNTQAIYIDDLLRTIKETIENPSFYNNTVNVVNGERINYTELIQQTSKYFGKRKLMIFVPINYTSFSKFWVTIFGEADYELVSPLIDSLLCELPSAPPSSKIEHLIQFKTYKEMLKKLEKKKIIHKKRKTKPSVNNVRSIQRLSNPGKLSEKEVGEEYLRWLPKHLSFLIKARTKGNTIEFCSIFLKTPLLVLRRITTNGELNRLKFHIEGGLLTKRSDTGWLEFRLVAGGKYTLVSINEFVPALPWYFYKITQAPFHAKVMKSFGKHLEKYKKIII